MPDLIDPRPLVGEPLALDLVNTRWRAEDLLVGPGGLAVWLHSNGLADRWPADPAALAALRQARDALVTVITDPDRSGPLNDVLARGRVRRSLVDGQPAEETELADPHWGPAWLAADNYLELLRRGPGRIRRCAGHGCILHFFDTSKNGTRRWCSMAGCGNRTKAARHYERRRGDH